MLGDSEELDLSGATISQAEAKKQSQDTVKEMQLFFKNLSQEVKRQQTKIKREVISQQLLHEYKRPYTFQHRTSINNQNKEDFARYIAEQENYKLLQLNTLKLEEQQFKSKIKEQNKIKKELDKIEKEFARIELARAKRRQAIQKKIVRANIKAIDTASGVVKSLAVGGGLSIAKLFNDAVSKFQPYASANRYGLLVGKNNTYENALIARARNSVYTNREQVSGEIAGYREKQFHYFTRRQEVNTHLHRLGLTSANSIKDVIKAIKDRYVGNDDQSERQRRQIARDVGLENVYIASLEKRATLEEKYVPQMEQLQKAYKELQGQLMDISMMTIPTFNKALKSIQEHIKTPGDVAEGIVDVIGGYFGITKGAKIGAKIGGLLGKPFGIPGTIIGNALGGVAGSGIGWATAKFAGEKAHDYIDNMVQNDNNTITPAHLQYTPIVNANIPKQNEVSHMTGMPSININYYGNVYRPEEIEESVKTGIQNAFDNRDIQNSLFIQTA